MRTGSLFVAGGLFLLASLFFPGFAASAETSAVAIPKSVRAEHEEIHSALVRATRAPGRTGAAAKELAKVLDPHFKREEEIALAPLGLLAPLSAGERIPDAAASDALKMSDTLKAELPRMLEEHKHIRAAAEKLGKAARAERRPAEQRLAEQLGLHAQNEEEVTYPAAVLVGELLRGQQKK